MSKKRRGEGSPYLIMLRTKPPLHWLKLAAWFSLVGYIAYLSGAHAIANIAWQQNPDLALRFVPDHPLALSRKADELFAEKQDPATLARVEAMAKQSLRGGALNPVAIRLLGYVADVRGDQNRARKLMLLSQKVSRRDFGTQLWLIEDAVARGDKKQALYHYDIAMRTTPSSHAILFPALTGALADPEVRQGLVPYVGRKPEWLAAFLHHAIAYSDNAANVAEMWVQDGSLPDDEAYAPIANLLLSKLAEKSNFAAFKQFYVRLKGTQRETFQTAAMNRLTVNLRYPQAGWQLTDGSAIGGAFSAADKQGYHSLQGFAGSGERGELIRKYMFLVPGEYRFSARHAAQENAPDGDIRWEMRCMSAKENTLQWFATSRVQKGRFVAAQDFSIGPDCANQLLSMQVAGGSGQLGAEFTLRSVDIARR